MRAAASGILIGVVVLTSSLLGASPASAADTQWSWCPEITDSVTRLYSAYFGRAPDDEGFGYWGNRWGTGSWDLPRVSAFFADSPEFEQLYGDLADDQFVDLVYDQVLGRPPEEDGRVYWMGRLGRGMNRGHMMLLFSESNEYIVKSGTTPFFGGEFKTLPRGATFYCGSGSQVIPVEYDSSSNIWVTAFGEVINSDSPQSGGNFIVEILDENLDSVGTVANEIIYWDRPESRQRSTLTNRILRSYSFWEPGDRLEIRHDADDMRYFVVFYPVTVRDAPFGDVVALGD